MRRIDRQEKEKKYLKDTTFVWLGVDKATAKFKVSSSRRQQEDYLNASVPEKLNNTLWCLILKKVQTGGGTGEYNDHSSAYLGAHKKKKDHFTWSFFRKLS